MTTSSDHRHWKYLGLALLLGIVLLSIFVLWEFLDVIVFGLAMAYIVYPLAKWLNKGNTEKSNKWVIACISAVLIVAIPVFIIVFYALNSALQWFIKSLPMMQSGEFLIGVKTTLNKFGFSIISERVASEIGKVITGFSERLSASILKPTWIIEMFLKIAMFFVSAFYFVYEGPYVKKLLDKHIPKREKFVKELIDSFHKICYGLFVGHFFTSVLIALMTTVGFWLILRPGIITLGILTIIMFVIAFLPVIGPWLMYVPLGVWYMIMVPGGFMQGLAIIIFGIIFLTAIPDFYLRPKFVQYSAELHPLLLILGFFGGPMLMGIKGFVIGPLVLGLAQAVVSLYIKKRHILKELVEHF